MRRIKYLAGFLMLVLACFFKTNVCLADDSYTNPDTGYEAVIIDDADLLSHSEERALLDDMYDITEYGNVVFHSSYAIYTSTSSYASDFLSELYGRDSASMFLIDMNNREIYITNNGHNARLITNSYCKVITDNFYKYATNGDYYSCASKSFGQMLTILRGGRISQPMKYICNLLIALIIAFLINYIIVRTVSRVKAPKNDELIAAINHNCVVHNPNLVFVSQSKTRHVSSSSGGGGGHSGGGHHSSGGHHSGGGHHF